MVLRDDSSPIRFPFSCRGSFDIISFEVHAFDIISFEVISFDDVPFQVFSHDESCACRPDGEPLEDRPVTSTGSIRRDGGCGGVRRLRVPDRVGV
ncbi:MAG: hypothetical protein EBS22_09625, partial [Acidimicrobiia bacterium]|nr:hypothetical protein [Acidimicrobiia bacterium]